MAFSKTPSQSTYQTKIIKLMKELNTRDASPGVRDEDYVNVYFELVKNKITGENDQYIVKRPGTAVYGVAGTYSNIRGMYYWEDQKRLYVAAGRDLLYYTIDTAAIGATYVNFFAGSTGTVGFTEFLYDTNTVTLIVTDGTTLKEITNAGAITTCADADLPSPHDPSPVFIDGYLFLLKTGTADVYNSNLNDPQNWTAGDFLTAEMSPDTCITISRLNNYMVVFGSSSIEYFWDAGNATGSPLQRNDTPVKNTGFLGGLATFANKVYFLGNENESGPAMYVLEDFKIKQISAPNVERYWNSLTTAYVGWKTCILSSNGHVFVIVDTGSSVTWVMEMETQLWTRWQWSTQPALPIVGLVNTKSATTYRSIMAVSTTGQLYQIAPSLYQDVGTNYTCTIVTPANEFETMNRKAWHRVTLWTDRANTLGVGTDMNVYWSDDDYKTWSNPVTVNLDQDLASIYRLGSARQRAFKFTYSDNFPMRLKQVEADINMGQS